MLRGRGPKSSQSSSEEEDQETASHPQRKRIQEHPDTIGTRDLPCPLIQGRNGKTSMQKYLHKAKNYLHIFSEWEIKVVSHILKKYHCAEDVHEDYRKHNREIELLGRWKYQIQNNGLEYAGILEHYEKTKHMNNRTNGTPVLAINLNGTQHMPGYQKPMGVQMISPPHWKFYLLFDEI
ncbi:hypothetical protein STEG23_014083 [Scotinomys teguina]